MAEDAIRNALYSTITGMLIFLIKTVEHGDSSSILVTLVALNENPPPLTP